MGLLQSTRKFLRGTNDSHASSTTPHGRFHHDRIAQLLRDGFSFGQILNGRLTAAKDGDTSLIGDLTGRRLVSQLLQDFG